MKTLTLLLDLFLTFTLTAAEPAKPAPFEVRLVCEHASAETEPLTLSQQRNAPGRTVEERLNVQKKPLLDRSALKSADVQKNPLSSTPEIQIVLTASGGKRFAEVTRQHAGRRLAIVVDGDVVSAPRVMSEISGGRVMISGSFTEEEAKQLAGKLNGSVRR